jgi:NADH-quinone oxidoreductase subunit L
MFDICYIILFTVLISYASGILFCQFFKTKITAKFYTLYNSLILALIVALFTWISIGVLFFNKFGQWTFNSSTLLSDIIDNCLGLGFHPVNFTFAYLVAIIGSATNLYVLNYFKNEADEMSFVFWLNAFIASMLLLVLSTNFFTLFLGWELIGLTSFFLINFWQARRGVLKSSFKAFSFNLVSDIFLLTALVCFYQCGRTTDCDSFIYLVIWGGITSNSVLNLGLISLVICAAVKSVQLGGHLWLPDSMEAPVPASALIHSATLVSAGIYLLCKFNLLYMVGGWTIILVLLGSFTAMYGGVVSSSQTDMKKLLAYSTMSHCGFLWVLASTGYLYITSFYLFFHGLFKAATFFCAGTFIRVYGTQDTRLMGNSHRFFPLESLLLIICAANLSGLPLMLGYLYKYYFIQLLFTSTIGCCVLGNLYIAMVSSILYFFRLTYYVVFDFYKNFKSPFFFLLVNRRLFLNNFRFSAPNQTVGLSILFVLACFTGLFFCWLSGVVPVYINYSFDNSQIYTSILSVSVLYLSQYFYFYFLYFTVLGVLIIINWRRNITAVESIIAFILCFFVVLL